MLSRGENKPSLGVGGTSTNCIPARPAKGSWRGFFVMVSARGDMSAASSGKVRNGITTWCSGATSWISAFFLGGAPRLNGTKPLGAGPASRLATCLGGAPRLSGIKPCGAGRASWVGTCGDAPKVIGTKPKPPGELAPNRWAPNPGEGGGLAND